MARYINELPMVNTQEASFRLLTNFLGSEKFEYCDDNGEMLFRKGRGAPSFVKVTYGDGIVRLEAWVDVKGEEQDLDGSGARSAKNSLRKTLISVERILSYPGDGYEPQQEAEGEALQEQRELTPMEEALAEGLEITKHEYFKCYATPRFYRNLRILAVISYISCGFLAIGCLTDLWVLVDLVAYLGLTLGMHLGKSKICAAALFGYALFGAIFIFLLTGYLTGWGWIAIGISALAIFGSENKRYEAFAENGE